MRMLEGEYFVHDGKLWFIKGHQHPLGMVIAYPRYSLLNFSKTPIHDQIYWDCLKLHVPVVSVNYVKPYKPRLIHPVEVVVKSVAETLGLNPNDYIVTGSSVLGMESRDVDLVIYSEDVGFIEEIINTVYRCFDRVNAWDLVEEYYDKHVKDTDLMSYLVIKRNTPLHFKHMGRRVNLRIVRFTRGYNMCVEPISQVKPFIGYVKVIDAVYRHVVPALYEVLVSGEKMFMETYREIYCELPRGTYYVEGRLEFRNKGVFIVPDHGSLRFVDHS